MPTVKEMESAACWLRVGLPGGPLPRREFNGETPYLFAARTRLYCFDKGSLFQLLESISLRRLVVRAMVLPGSR